MGWMGEANPDTVGPYSSLPAGGCNDPFKLNSGIPVTYKIEHVGEMPRKYCKRRSNKVWTIRALCSAGD